MRCKLSNLRLPLRLDNDFAFSDGKASINLKQNIQIHTVLILFKTRK